MNEVIKKKILGKEFDIERSTVVPRKRISVSSANRRTKPYSLVRSFLNIFLALGILLMTVFFVHTFFLTTVRLTVLNKEIADLEDNSFHFVLKNSDLFKVKLNYADVVAIKTYGLGEYSDTASQLQRIVALPHDEVLIDNGKLYVNGKESAETYLPDEMKNGKTILYSLRYQHLVLGEEMYFVMGDNRTDAVDSRIFGPIRRDQIMYKILR